MLQPWIHFLFNWVAGAALIGAAQKFWPFTKIILALIPKHLRNGDTDHAAMTKARLDKRMENVEPRPDLFVFPSLLPSTANHSSISNLQRTLGTKSGMSYAELIETARVLVVGGTETTASLLSGMTYYLLSNPHKLHKLTAEIRSTFANPSSITMATVLPLPYLNAVINEALRLFPPLPGNLRRITPPAGSYIADKFIPGGMMVAIDIFAANHSASNFALPEAFCPERWLSNCPDIFEDDELCVSQAVCLFFPYPFLCPHSLEMKKLIKGNSSLGDHVTASARTSH
jgi:cytochrome P450